MAWLLHVLFALRCLGWTLQFLLIRLYDLRLEKRRTGKKRKRSDAQSKWKGAKKERLEAPDALRRTETVTVCAFILVLLRKGSWKMCRTKYIGLTIAFVLVFFVVWSGAMSPWWNQKYTAFSYKALYMKILLVGIQLALFMEFVHLISSMYNDKNKSTAFYTSHASEWEKNVISPCDSMWHEQQCQMGWFEYFLEISNRIYTGEMIRTSWKAVATSCWKWVCI